LESFGGKINARGFGRILGIIGACGFHIIWIVANFIKHCAYLWAVKQRIIKNLSMKLNGYSDSIQLSDGF
jgi:hypothetical protein